ncbi:SDR family NAD(P)-dependent oxidoreductase [Trebonia sp.]|uniref:SDR family NAD(P)-dependent oxidoreductase n=1 Tax=Trebonia sp. TaxID=2767075 RepID=UPI002607F01B|nr:SDR family NAD(P)-dependent oxidoreductase [Trebonia sp.]
MFQGKIAVVTGAAAGIGYGLAKGYAEGGAAVALLDIDESALDRAVTTLESDGHTVAGLVCDVSSRAAVDEAISAAVSTLGGIDILVNNAGLHLTHYNKPFGELSESDIRALFDVNVLGVVNCSRAVAPAMKARGGGAIVNIASVAGYISQTPYGVSKLAVRGLTIAFAHELAECGIRVNAVAPGLIGTDSTNADIPEGLREEIVRTRQLVHRQGRVADIVDAILYLSSGAASYVTGETLKVAGGNALQI